MFLEAIWPDQSIIATIAGTTDAHLILLLQAIHFPPQPSTLPPAENESNG